MTTQVRHDALSFPTSRRLVEHLAQMWAEGFGEADVCHQSASEKSAYPAPGAVDYLSE
jgi:hypothetical protein